MHICELQSSFSIVVCAAHCTEWVCFFFFLFNVFVSFLFINWMEKKKYTNTHRAKDRQEIMHRHKHTYVRTQLINGISRQTESKLTRVRRKSHAIAYTSMHVCSLVWSPVFPFSVPLNIDIGKCDTEELTACKQNWPRLLSYLLSRSLFRSLYTCTCKKNRYSMYHNRQCAYVLCFVSLRLCVAVLYRFLAHSAITFLLARLFFSDGFRCVEWVLSSKPVLFMCNTNK